MRASAVSVAGFPELAADRCSARSLAPPPALRRLPPPKRVKLSGPSLDVPAPVVPKAATVVVQFRSSVDGSSMGPAVSLPADTGRDGMEMLVNRLKGVEDVRPVPLLPCPPVGPPAAGCQHS